MNVDKSINLMVVEDERVVAFDLKNQLQSFGYRVGAIAASGEQAIRLAAEVAPDLVLMDIRLEGTMDGIDAATEIQARYQIPVIYVTAFAEDDTLNRALASRPFGYLVKPWDLRELHASIQMALARREAEVAVENSEHRLNLAMDAAALGVFEWTSQSNRIHGYGHLGAMFGDQHMLLDEPWDDFVARVRNEDRERVATSLEQTLSNGEAVRIEFQTARISPAPQVLQASVKAYPGVGTERRVVGVLQDVTLRNLSEERLRQSSVVFHNAAEAMVIARTDRRISAVNPAFTRITGYSETEAIGFDVDVLLRVQRSGPGGALFFSDLEKSAEGYWQGEVMCQRRGGEHFPAWQSLSTVRNADGQAINFVIAFSDVSALHQAEERLNHLAHHDVLTGLPNRLLFDDRFERALEGARRQHAHCLLFFLDLDSFKIVNDTLGHTMGDELLRVVANRLRDTLRTTDTIARQGGDEFVILTGDTGPREAVDLAQKILDTLHDPITLGADRVTVSGSIGIAIFPEDGSDRNMLMRAADIAMYSAKASGRNRYRFYSPDMAQRSNDRLRMEQGLRRAIAEDQLHLHYQPQVSLVDGRITGVEALVRWMHPELGLIPPARFIPIAEESGVIDALGSWVLDRACRDMAGVLDAEGNQLRLAINTSVREFMRDDFVACVQGTLQRTGFPSMALEIEITESTLQVIERSVEVLGKLHALGTTVSIDDFGTGFSSLSVLRALPIDRIKIDRSFIHDFPETEDGIAVVEALITLAISLRMEIIVEGIERPSQAAALRRIGCHAGQGYLFSQPLEKSALFDLLATGVDLNGDPSAIHDH